VKVSERSPTAVGGWLSSGRAGAALLGALAVWVTWGAVPLQAQQWRGRVTSRIEYVEARPLVLDSVPLGIVEGEGTQRFVGDTLVTCSTGVDHCFFYRPGSTIATTPAVLDLDLSVFGFGVEGLRAYISTRLRTGIGNSNREFWPRTNDEFDLLYAYGELNRRYYRVRLGRDWQVSGLGFYGYDGGSLLIRLPPGGIELEAYGGWGLERGLPERVTADDLGTLGIFQPQDDNYLFGFRGSARPFRGASLEAIYQREIETDRSGVTSERLGFEASYAPTSDWLFEGHADYDLATGWWGKAGGKVGWSPLQRLWVEGRLFRYRPVFSLQQIWAVFSPVAYWGWGGGVGVDPGYDLSLRFEVERLSYDDTDAESPFLTPTTDRTWRFGASGAWTRFASWDVSAGYWLTWGFGAGTSSGNIRLNYYPFDVLTLGVRYTAFDQVWEYRVPDNFVWSLGAEARLRTTAGTLYGSIDRYRHDRDEDVTQTDWTQVRAALGFSYYLGSEPGRRP